MEPRTCLWCGKICHATRSMAMRAARRAYRRGRRLRAYRCPAGQGWHLTSARPRRKQQAIRERARRYAQIRTASPVASPSRGGQSARARPSRT